MTTGSLLLLLLMLIMLMLNADAGADADDGNDSNKLRESTQLIDNSLAE